MTCQKGIAVSANAVTAQAEPCNKQNKHDPDHAVLQYNWNTVCDVHVHSTHPIKAVTIRNGGVEGGAHLIWEGRQPGCLPQVGQDQDWIANGKKADLQKHA